MKKEIFNLYVKKFWHARHSEDIAKFLKEFQYEDLSYWKTRCELAEKCLEKSPCDPDITADQIAAHNAYNTFINTNT